MNRHARRKEYAERSRAQRARARMTATRQTNPYAALRAGLITKRQARVLGAHGRVLFQ